MADNPMKVTLKVNGEEDRTFDLSNPDDIASFKQKAEKGRWYEKNEEDISKKLKRLEGLEGKAKIADNWQAYLDQVRSGDIPVDDLYDKFETMGIKLNAQEKKEIRDDVYIDEDNSMVRELEAKIAGLEKKLDKSNENQVATQIESTLKTLTKRYDGSNGYPKFDINEVVNFVKSKNLYMDSIEETYENAYVLMNKEDILKAERESSTSASKELEKRRNQVAEDKPGNISYKFSEKIDTKQSWNKIGNQILEDMHKQGKSVFLTE